MLLGNDVMLAVDGATIGAERGKGQGMVENPLHLCQFETCKASVMGVAETRRQDQPQGLTDELLESVGVVVPEGATFVDLAELSDGFEEVVGRAGQ